MTSPQIDDHLRDGLHAAAEQAPTAPGLFEALAGRARRRAARTRIAAAAGACAAVGTAVGVTLLPGSTHSRETVSPTPAVIRYSCPAGPPEMYETSRQGRLLVPTPAAAVLCQYSIAGPENPTKITVSAVPLTGARLDALMKQLTAAPDVTDKTKCTLQKVDPTQILALEFTDRPPLPLVIDFSGCGTVASPQGAKIIPPLLSDLLMK